MASRAGAQAEYIVPAVCSLSPMATPQAGSGRPGSQPSESKTFAIVIAGCNAGVGQEGVRPFHFNAAIHCMNTGLFVTLTMVKHEKIGSCSLPLGRCTIAWTTAAWQQQAKSPREEAWALPYPAGGNKELWIGQGQLTSLAYTSRRKLQPLRIAAARPLAVNHTGPVAA